MAIQRSALDMPLAIRKASIGIGVKRREVVVDVDSTAACRPHLDEIGTVSAWQGRV